MVTFPPNSLLTKAIPLSDICYSKIRVFCEFYPSTYNNQRTDYSGGDQQTNTCDTVGNVVYEKFLFKGNQHLEIPASFLVPLYPQNNIFCSALLSRTQELASD